MSDDSGKTKKKIRRGDRALNEARTAKNKKRNIATDARRKARDAELRPRRLAKRKYGAFMRLDARCKISPNDEILHESRIKAEKAYHAAVSAA